MQLIRSESFVTVSVCQCDSSSKATAQLDTMDLAPSCAQRPHAFHNQTLRGSGLSFGLLSQIIPVVDGSLCFQSIEMDSRTFLSLSSLESGHVSLCRPFPSNGCQVGLIRGVPADLWSDTQHCHLTLGRGVPLCHSDTPTQTHTHRIIFYSVPAADILYECLEAHGFHAFRVSWAWQRLRNKRKRDDRKGEQADKVKKGCQWKLLP